MVVEIRKRLIFLEKEAFKMKKISRLGIFTLTMAITILLILPAAQALDFKISGQVNRAVLWGDNGNDDDVKFVDNENSSTRFRFTGSNEFNENWKVGFKWENQMESNTSIDTSLNDDGDGTIDIGSNDDAGDINFTERHMDIWVEHKMFGKVSLGQGDTASNSTAEVDLSGTDVIMYSSVADLAGGFTFRDDDDNVILNSGGTFSFINNVFSNFDGLSRRDRIRYDTPTFYGFFASTSYMNGQSYDFALRSAHEWENFGKLAAAVGYVPGNNQRFPWRQLSGSISFLHNSGLNLTFSHGFRDFDVSASDDAKNYYGKLGYQIGKWALAVDYAYAENVEQDDDEATSIGVGAVWNIWESVQFYGAYRWQELERDNLNVANTGDPEDINAVMIGARVKF
jgi:predicted porin